MTDPNVPHRFELDLEIAATPEEVWHAISTAAGISSWMLPTEIDTRPGGAVVFHMGPEAESAGTVTDVEPTRRLVYEEDWATLAGHGGAEVTPLVTEFLIESRAGGSCSVRVVTSAFGTGADWENEFFADMSVGWAPMLDNLRLYVESFPGQTAATMWLGAVNSIAPEAAIEALRGRLGVAAAGDATRVRGVDATVERVLPLHLMLRAITPVRGFLSFSAFGEHLLLTGYLFGDDAARYVEAEQPTWQEWLEEVAVATTGESAP